MNTALIAEASASGVSSKQTALLRRQKRGQVMQRLPHIIDLATKYGEISTLCFASSVPLSPTLAGRVARCIGPPFRKHAACGAKPLLHPLLRFKCALVPSRERGLDFPPPSWGRDRGRGGECATGVQHV